MSVDTSLPWVIRTDIRHAEDVAQLRRIRGLTLLVDGDVLWLRGETREADLDRRIRSLPDAEMFDIQLDEQLTRPGEAVPSARLPDGTWQAISLWFTLQLPRTGFAAAHNERVMLKLVRSSALTEANFLETAWKTWFDYAISAPQIRLNPVGFALGDADTVLVRGTPLPPIPGRRYTESQGIIIPTGWRFEPDVGAIVVRQVLALDDEELALFSEDGSFERLPQAAFVQATRSAVRATNHE
jgi:hypothetical protein